MNLFLLLPYFRNGDCSLIILDASAEYDEGLWQCQVSAGDIAMADSLISNGAILTVIIPPTEVILQNIEVPNEAVCVTSASNPPAKLLIFVDDEIVDVGDNQHDVRQSCNEDLRNFSRSAL